jgi:hypothetical protein
METGILIIVILAAVGAVFFGGYAIYKIYFQGAAIGIYLSKDLSIYLSKDLSIYLSI